MRNTKKECKYCESDLIRRANECNRDYNRRSFCDQKCLHDSLKKSARHKTLVKKKCDKEYYRNNKEVIIKRVQDWVRDNGYIHQKKWKKSHKEKLVEYRAKRKISDGRKNDFNSNEWAYILRVLGYECFYCGNSGIKLTQDHIIPLCRGGENTMMNIVPSCLSCNSSKGGKLINEWRI